MKPTKPKLLIIDDSQEVLMSLKSFFLKNDCEVCTALGGEEGLALANLHKFKAILIDIYMPIMQGDEVLKKMKKIHPSTPIIMITGYDDEEIAKKCMEMGAYDYIHKPFDLEYLETSVLSTIVTS